jgi:hypothetical protein
MGCHLAENGPLKRLRDDLGFPDQCHSLRPRCIEGFEPRKGSAVLGAPGAVIGYCQALFNYAGNPAAHTRRVVRLLNEIEAPWANSHELFWGFRRDESPSAFVQRGITPLLGNGRVPIVITGLDPARDKSTIESILATDPVIYSGETILVRIILGNDDSIFPAAEIITRLLKNSIASKEMPKWWPLLQTNFNVSQWKRLRNLLGSAWKYVNVAVNPFGSADVVDFAAQQLTIAQVVLGGAAGIFDDGHIQLAPGVKVFGSSDAALYSLDDYARQLSTLEIAPTLIVLGPSAPDWTDRDNKRRIAKFLPILRRACDQLWNGIQPMRREAVWKLAA